MSDAIESVVSMIDNPQAALPNLAVDNANNSDDTDESDGLAAGAVNINQIEPNGSRNSYLRGLISKYVQEVGRRRMFNDGIMRAANEEITWEGIAERNSVLLAEAQSENRRLRRVINHLNEDNIHYQKVICDQEQLLKEGGDLFENMIEHQGTDNNSSDNEYESSETTESSSSDDYSDDYEEEEGDDLLL